MPNKILLKGFGIQLPSKDDVSRKVASTKEEKKVTKRNTLSNSLSLEEKLATITQIVNERLGKFKYNTEVIRSIDHLNSYLEATKTAGVIAIDTETNKSTDPITCKIMGMCIYTPGRKAAYIPINHINNSTGKRLENQLTENDLKNFVDELRDVKIIMHNASFDIQVIDWTCLNTQNGIKCYWDTMLAAKLLDENNSARLKDLYGRFIDPDQESYNIETFFKTVDYETVDPEVFALYAATDAYETYRVYEWQVREFEKLNDPKLYSVFKDIEMEVLPVTVEMEETGIGIDFQLAKNMHLSYNQKLEKCYQGLMDIVSQYSDKIDSFKKSHPDVKLDDPIAINSPKQLAILLYDIIGVKPGNPDNPRSTGEKDLLKIKHPIIQPILDYREFCKLVSTYVDKLPASVSTRTKKIHAHFNQIGVEDNTVVTGRFSSSNPNLQNIPSHDKKIRNLFVPDPGMVFVGGDFSQQEPRLLSHYSQDKDLIEAYMTGKDLYATMASKVYEKDYWDCMEHHEDGSANPEGKKLRSNCKSIVLGLLYGRGAASIAEQTKSTVQEARDLIDTFYKAYPSVKKWMDDSVAMAQEKGFVTTVCGRRRRLPNVNLPPFTIKSKVEEAADTLLFEKVLLKKDSVNTVSKYLELLNSARSKDQKDKIIKEASSHGLEVVDNNGYIAGAKRQCVNARVQGGAADISKRAMVKIFKDPRLRELGFKTLFCIHDEIAGQCPVENADKVAELLKEDMISSAGEVCSVPMKVDCYKVSHWYNDDFSDNIEGQYQSLVKDSTPEEAFSKIREENPEIDRDILKQMCEGTYDCTVEKYAAV